MTLPNKLTLLRIINIPIVLWLFYSDRYGLFLTGFFLGLALSLTDFMDGYLARKLGQISSLGKIIDPIADKLFVLLLCLYFVDIGMLAAWVLILLIFRELVISDFRLLAYKKGGEVAVSMVGKWKAVSQFTLLGYLGAMKILFFHKVDGVHIETWPLGYQGGYYLILLAVIALTLISLIEYFWSNRHLLVDLTDSGINP
jgi:CDP-diacylglycerol--glycerol-3-phosphate 3-phosphatidyltransferase